MTDDNLFGEVTFAYTRAQALEDGVLIDVSTLAREAGIKYPIAVTSAVWNIIEDIPPDSGQDIQGRLWDVIWMLRMEIRRSKGDTIHYTLLMDRTGTRERELELKSVCGPGDNAEPVITIMLPDED